MICWVVEELKTTDLGDRRLNKRAVLLAEHLANYQQVSTPQACTGWAETQAVYRFLAQVDESHWTISSRHTGRLPWPACAPIA